ncbi:uncharacterized protein LOC115627332 [Scaptodrosophila lebanonensis]|uniref:Uncharacterized protein LOC115627332 n=1 Tax=Drosophila lebanonensis TaxID=7225 RepID=A0A6J2TVB7_DROLE|nr:uncharacterized protein LOC115627332 [Scaptodrosophila lebanonensis]
MEKENENKAVELHSPRSTKSAVASHNNQLQNYESITSPQNLCRKNESLVAGIQNMSRADYVANWLNENYKFLNESDVSPPPEFLDFSASNCVQSTNVDAEEPIECKDSNKVLGDSNDEGLLSQFAPNPFIEAIENVSLENTTVELAKDETPERIMFEIMQIHVAIPDYALSDTIYNVDRPLEAIPLDLDIPPMPLPAHCKIDALLRVHVSEVYSPFQFWFHFTNTGYDPHERFSYELNLFYCQQQETRWNVGTYFIRPGVICAAAYLGTWRRAKILAEPRPSTVMVYFIDYGIVAEVAHSDLRFLHLSFSELPALISRGTLSHVHPLGLHWHRDSTAGFKELVKSADLYARVTDIDHTDRVVTMDLSYNSNFNPTFGMILTKVGLAGMSEHFKKDYRDIFAGCRIRYLRERLPTFEMLENHTFPVDADNAFEDAFDKIIYAPDFFDKFKPPKLNNPFRINLENALASWLEKNKKEETELRKLYKEHKRKLKQQFNKQQCELLEETIPRPL